MQCAAKELCLSRSIQIQPKPASFRSSRQAASTWSFVTPARSGLCWLIQGGADIDFYDASHSFAAVTARVIRSAGEQTFLAKTSSFLAFHRNHKIQGARFPVVMPKGGRHSFSIPRDIQIYPSSSIKVCRKGSKIPYFPSKITVEEKMIDRFWILTADAFCINR